MSTWNYETTIFKQASAKQINLTSNSFHFGQLNYSITDVCYVNGQTVITGEAIRTGNNIAIKRIAIIYWDELTEMYEVARSTYTRTLNN